MPFEIGLLGLVITLTCTMPTPGRDSWPSLRQPLRGPLDRVRQLVSGWLGHVQEIRVAELAVGLREHLASKGLWQEAGRALFERVPAGHVLILDEFPVMLKAVLDSNPSEAVALLRWLRQERQREGAPRFVLAGSTSLTELCRQAQLSDAINDLQVLALPALSRREARGLLSAVLKDEGASFSPRVLEAALDLVGSEVPYFLQILAQAMLAELAPDGRGGRSGLTPARVRLLYEEKLLGAEGRVYLDDFHGRLDRSYLPPEKEVALIMLRWLSTTTNGLSLSELRERVIAGGADEELCERVATLLDADFYVSADAEGRYRFRNRYLADWWRRFHA